MTSVSLRYNMGTHCSDGDFRFGLVVLIRLMISLEVMFSEESNIYFA